MGEKRAWIVAVDGPAGSGKSSICASACSRLDWTYVNTGAIYRAIGFLMERNEVNANDEAGLGLLIDEFAAHFRWDSHSRQLTFKGEDLTPFLSSEVAGKNASKIAKIPVLRERLLPIQRQLALSAPKGVLMDGRDIGTVVFPSADLKIFMTAGLEQRAKRRLSQLQEKHPSEIPATLQDVMEDMQRRDHQDSKRGVAPLLKADDAILLDTSNLTVEETIESLIKLIRVHLHLY